MRQQIKKLINCLWPVSFAYNNNAADVSSPATTRLALKVGPLTFDRALVSPPAAEKKAYKTYTED